jgi:hypothetical protein
MGGRTLVCRNGCQQCRFDQYEASNLIWMGDGIGDGEYSASGMTEDPRGIRRAGAVDGGYRLDLLLDRRVPIKPARPAVADPVQRDAVEPRSTSNIGLAASAVDVAPCK